MKIFFTIKYVVLAELLCFILPYTTKAQLSNCNGFLKGNYLEAGLNWNGTFGSSTRPPAGYHPQNTASLYNSPTCSATLFSDTSIGFVADPAKDGWSAGTPPYFGDYILPGGPQEGWSYMADGIQYNAWSHNDATVDTLTGGMTCYIESFSDTLGSMQIKTQSVVNTSTYITHIFTLDTGQLFITVEVYIDNTSLATSSGIFYMRTITPHNDQSESSVATTNNKIEYTLPDSLNRNVVTARGTVYNAAYLSLATQDTRSISFISRSAPLPNSTTIDNIFAGDASYLYGLDDSTTGDDAIGLIYNIGILPSGGEAYFKFIYAFSSLVIDSNLNVQDTSHVNVVNIAHTNKYNLYPNPVGDRFSVSGMVPGDRVELVDMMGRKMDAAAIVKAGANHFEVISIPAGVYILAIDGQDGVTKTRLPFRKL